MRYQLAKMLPVMHSQLSLAQNDDEAKLAAEAFLQSQPPGTYLLTDVHPHNGKHVVAATYEVRAETKVSELLARFEL